MTHVQTKEVPTRAESVAILVDVPNLHGTAKHQHGGRQLDLVKLRDRAAGGRQVVETLAYFCTPDGVRVEAVRKILEQRGFQVRHRTARFNRASGGMLNDWVVKTVIDAVTLAREVDTIILISGRGEYVDLVDHLKQNGIRIEVCAFESSVNETLRGTADAFTPITPDLLLPVKRGRDHHQGATA